MKNLPKAVGQSDIKYPLGIATALYNQPEFVPEIIENAKSMAGYGVISYLQDDCSTDETFALLKSLGESASGVAISKTLENGGCRANLADILQKADTEYILFKGGDDYIVTPSIEKVLSDIERAPNTDICIYCCAHVKKEAAFRAAMEPNINSNLQLQQCRNYWLMEKNWGTALELLEACSRLPASLWVQGMVIKTSVAKKAGFLPAGRIDDWGLIHNLALLCGTKELNIELRPEILSVLSVVPSSQGQDVITQLMEQTLAIENYWSDNLKKEALLNVLAKKMMQMQKLDIDYSSVKSSIKAAIDNITAG